MTTESVAPSGPSDDGVSDLNIEEAFALIDARLDDETPEGGPETATPEQESPPQEADAAPDEKQATGETESEQAPDENPPLPLPRSWTKEQTEHWNALPRETQEYLREQDSKASAEVRREKTRPPKKPRQSMP